MVGHGHEPDSMGLYIHYTDSLVSRRMTIPQYKELIIPIIRWHVCDRQHLRYPMHNYVVLMPKNGDGPFKKWWNHNLNRCLACSVKYKSKKKLLETKTSQRNFGKKQLCLHKLVGRNLCLHRGQYIYIYIYFVLIKTGCLLLHGNLPGVYPPPMPRFPKKFAGLIYPLKVDSKFVQFGSLQMVMIAQMDRCIEIRVNEGFFKSNWECSLMPR